MTQFLMPSLGADMEAGTLYEWFVSPGDTLERGAVIASVETEKGVIDIECFEEGVVGQLLVEPGTRVPVGEPIAVLQTAEEPAAVPVTEPAAPPPQPEAPAQVTKPPTTVVTGNGGRIKVSPAARRLAAELEIDLKSVRGSGPQGAIGLADVEQAAARLAPAPEAAPDSETKATPVARRLADELGIDLAAVAGTGPHGVINRADVERAVCERLEQQSTVETRSVPTTSEKKRAEKPEETPDFQTAMRHAIALAMAKSNREIPHYYLEARIDMSRSLRWLETENARRSLKERILPVVLLIKATARALGDLPDLNGYWQDDRFQPSEAIHIGFAIALRQGGLVTPAIHHADLKSVDELMEAVSDLILRTRGGRLRSSELTDATITLTSLGDTGVDKVYGVIYPPQVALVGFGRITEQPWAENGMVGVRSIVTATLAGDHRASDGRKGAQFLSALDNYLQQPEAL